jgi:hypothetical protein
MLAGNLLEESCLRFETFSLFLLLRFAYLLHFMSPVVLVMQVIVD